MGLVAVLLPSCPFFSGANLQGRGGKKSGRWGAAALEESWVGRTELVSEQGFAQQPSDKESGGEEGPRESQRGQAEENTPPKGPQGFQDTARKDLEKYTLLLLLLVMIICEILQCIDPGPRELTLQPPERH